MEFGVRQDIDLDQELKVEAAGNILAGLGGGFAGYGTLALSMLGPRSNIFSRIIPVTGALVCFGILFFGSTYFVGKRVREIFEQENLPEHIMLDLTKVQGFDISAVNSFQRIAQGKTL